MLAIGLRRYVYSRHIAIIVVVSIELSHCRNFTEFGQGCGKGPRGRLWVAYLRKTTIIIILFVVDSHSRVEQV